MSRLRSLVPFCWLPAVTVGLLLSFGSLRCVFGQEPGVSFRIPDTRPTSPNPRPDRRETNSRRNTSSQALPHNAPESAAEKEKQQVIKKAIEAGNQARKESQYELAFANYQSVLEQDPKDERAYYGSGNLYSDLYCFDSAITQYRKAIDLEKDYLEAVVGLGYAYVGKERYDDAEKQFLHALTVKPNNVDSRIGLGIVYRTKGNYQAAIEQINFVLNDKSVTDQDRALASIALGDVYWKQEKWPDVIAQYQKALDLNPKLDRAYLSLGAAQMTAAFSRFASIKPQDASADDRRVLAGSARDAAANIEKAINEHGYSKPDGYLFLSHALIQQSRYQDAVSKTKIYLVKIGEIERPLTPSVMSIAAKCDYGFARLKSEGYWQLAFIREEESLSVINPQQKAGLLSEAAKNYAEAIRLREDHVHAYSGLATIYMQQEKYEEAIAQYHKAIIHAKDESSKARFRKNISINHRLKGRDYEKQGKYAEAIVQYENALRNATEDPDRARIYEAIGLAYSSLKRVDDAISNVNEAIKRDPTNPSFYESLASIYITQNNFEETLKWLKRADEVRKTPSTKPDPYHFVGVTYTIRFIYRRNEEDFKEAVKWLKKAIEIKSDSASAYQALGNLYQYHADADDALLNLKLAIKYDPQNINNYLDVASVYVGLKQNNRAAIGYLKKSNEIKETTDAHSQLGVAYHREGNDTEAIKHGLRAIEIDPKSLDSHLHLASIYRDQRKYAETIRYINKAIEIAPDDFRPYKDLAKVHEIQHNNAEAIHNYQEAIKNFKLDIPWLRNLYLCRIERLRARYLEAISCFQKIPNFNDPAQIYYDVGVTYVAGKNKKAALAEHQKLKQIRSFLAVDLLRLINEIK